MRERFILTKLVLFLGGQDEKIEKKFWIKIYSSAIQEIISEK